MDNKKKFAAICIGFLILSASVGTTLAYLGDKDEKPNQIKIGTDIAKVEESDWSEPEYQKQENTNDKTITVQNTGSVPCFVRVYAEFSDSEIANLAYVTDGKDKDRKWEGTVEIGRNENLKTYLAGTHDDENWVFIPETGGSYDSKLRGYFYYKKVLKVDDPTTTDVETNAITTPLIKKVKVDYPDDNIDKYKAYEMIVYTETVQAVDTDANGTVYGDDDWLTAWKRFLKIPVT